MFRYASCAASYFGYGNSPMSTSDSRSPMMSDTAVIRKSTLPFIIIESVVISSMFFGR